ncbi:MAG: hypothetical protein DHS20C21_10080 [Gemmatimonadota bacterium]|nr:MAG: hypothetical protein DHS20C21_10080 [Gemmatimonadota bacterium]
MEEFLLRVLTDLPGRGAFLAGVGGGLFLAGGVVFLLQRTAAGRALVTAVGRFVSLFIAVVLLVMVFLSSLQILLRNAFDTGLLWIDPLLRHLVLVLAFSGALIATGAKRHVQISVLGRLLRGVPARVAGTLVALLAGVICVLLGYAGLELLAEELDFGEIAFLNIPAWAVAMVFPVAFLAMAFQFFHMLFLEIADVAPGLDEEIAAVVEHVKDDAEPTGEAG